MGLLAISDIHVGYEENFRALTKITARPSDWLMLGGDIAEHAEDLERTLVLLKDRFAKLIWIPGNHELWTMPNKGSKARGEAKYLEMVEVCRSLDVVTPEDPFPVYATKDATYTIAPLFLLYDYSFRPPEIALENAIEWAAEKGIQCADEHVLHPDPYPSRQAWCEARCKAAYERLKRIPLDHKIILLNHFPTVPELAHLPLIPRFSLWCGTELTKKWHKEFNVEAVVYGHLHWPRSKTIDGVRFEEVSVGYPRQWKSELGIDRKVREIIAAERT